VEGRAGEGVRSEGLPRRLQFGTRAERAQTLIFWGQGVRRTGPHVGPWKCAICKVVGVGSKVWNGSWTWSGRRHPVGRYRAASGVWSSKIASARQERRCSRLLRAERALRRRDGCRLPWWLSIATLGHVVEIAIKNFGQRVYQSGTGSWRGRSSSTYKSRISLANQAPACIPRVTSRY
jgi:hypothetical protein